MSVNYEFGRTRQASLAGARQAGHEITRPVTSGTVLLSLISEVLQISEAAIVFLAAITAKLLYIDGFLHSTQLTLGYAGMGLMGALTAVTALRQAGLYEPKYLLRHSIPIGRILSSLCVAMLVLLSVLYLLKASDQYSRGWMLTWFALICLGVLAERFVLQRVMQGFEADGRFTQRIAICGSGRIGKSVRDYLAHNPNVHIVGVFDDRREAVRRDKGERDGGLDDLIALGQRNTIDRIIVALPFNEDERINRILEELRILPKEIDLCPALERLPCPSRTTHTIGLLPLFEVLSPPLSDQDYVIKTLVDYVLGAILLIAALPLFAIVAAAIKLDSKGPVFFVQRRHGYNHQVMRVYKFRTMTVCEDADVVVQAKKNDKRVTRLGRFLRRTSLDELPQLINVLKGEMSLVGPRPHAIAHDNLYNKQVERYANRLRVKPGITGWAQVNGYRGETAQTELMRKRIEHDLWYIQNWSLWLDIEIILRTLLVCFFNPKAY